MDGLIFDWPFLAVGHPLHSSMFERGEIISCGREKKKHEGEYGNSAFEKTCIPKDI